MNRGRPAEFDREQVLDAAMQLFWDQGYEATSLADLLDVMQLSRSSLYQGFGSKHALFESCLDRYREQLTGSMWAGLAAAASPRSFLEQIFLDVAGETRRPDTRRGCLVMNTASEFAQRDPDITRVVQRATRAFRAVFRAALQQAQDAGEISPDKNVDVLAAYLVSSMTGLRTLIKAGAGAREVRDIAGIVLQALN